MTFVGSWDLRILINNHTWPRDWMKKGDNYDSFLASGVLLWFLNSQWVMLNATTDTFLKHDASQKVCTEGRKDKEWYIKMKTFWPCDRCHQPVWWDKTWGAIGVLILFSVLSTTAYVNTYGGRRWAAPLSKVEGEWEKFGTHHMFCWRPKRPSIWGKNEQTWPGLIWMVLFPSDTKHNYSISAGHSLPGCFAIRECPSGSSLSLPKYEALYTVSRNSTLFSQFFPSPPCSNLLLSLQGDFRRNIFRNVGINVMYALSLAEEPCSRTNQNCSERWGCLENSETLSCKTSPDSQIDHYMLKDRQTILSKPSFSMIQGSCFWFSSWLCPNPTSSTASIESTVTCEAKFGRQVTISEVYSKLLTFLEHSRTVMKCADVREKTSMPQKPQIYFSALHRVRWHSKIPCLQEHPSAQSALCGWYRGLFLGIAAEVLASWSLVGNCHSHRGHLGSLTS